MDEEVTYEALSVEDKMRAIEFIYPTASVRLDDTGAWFVDASIFDRRAPIGRCTRPTVPDAISATFSRITRADGRISSFATGSVSYRWSKSDGDWVRLEGDSAPTPAPKKWVFPLWQGWECGTCGASGLERLSSGEAHAAIMDNGLQDAMAAAQKRAADRHNQDKLSVYGCTFQRVRLSGPLLRIDGDGELVPWEPWRQSND